MAARLRGRVERLQKIRRETGPCSVCEGRGRINVYMEDENGASLDTGHTRPGGCDECGEELKIVFRRVTRIEKLWR